MADLVVPPLGESITEAVIGKWLVGVGDHVDADDPVVDLETDKITVQLPSPTAGALKEQRFSEGDTVKVGDIVGTMDPNAKPAAAPAKASKPDPRHTAPTVEPKPAPPAAKPAATAAPEAAPERGADGRVLPPSMRRAVLEGRVVPTLGPEGGAALKDVVPNAGPKEETVKMSPLRKRIAERLVEVQQSSASLTTFNEVDMSALMALRGKHKEAFLEAHGVKLGFMSFFVKAAVAALKLFPGLNAEVRGDSIVYKKHYDVGIAVGTEKGLVVPVLRNCDRLGFEGIEGGIVELATRAKKGRLGLDDLTGGTFTITNGGIYGSMMSTPILNYPQTAILGMHNIVKRPVVVGDSVEVRPVMYLAVTYDHRVVDGKEAVQFLVAIKERIENPEKLMFGL